MKKLIKSGMFVALLVAGEQVAGALERLGADVDGCYSKAPSSLAYMLKRMPVHKKYDLSPSQRFKAISCKGQVLIIYFESLDELADKQDKLDHAKRAFKRSFEMFNSAKRIAEASGMAIPQDVGESVNQTGIDYTDAESQFDRAKARMNATNRLMEDMGLVINKNGHIYVPGDHPVDTLRSLGEKVRDGEDYNIIHHDR